MPESRRSFFAASLSWLASLPVLSAWMARPVEASNVRGTQGPKPGDWLAHSDGRLVMPLQNMAATGLSLIRWISVKERLPEIDPQRYVSREVLVFSDIGIGVGFVWQSISGKQTGWEVPRITCTIHQITHWAELPSAPSDSREGAK